MLLDLKQIYDNVGEKKDFVCEVSANAFPVVGGRNFSDGAEIEGSVFNRAGIVTLKEKVHTVITTQCDRCLRSVRCDLGFDFEHILVRSLNGEDNDEYIVTNGDVLDTDALAVSDIILCMPTKILCREDCKGLCQKCGADLNEGSCGCE